MLFIDLTKSGDFKPVSLKPGSDTGSKTTYTTKSQEDKDADEASESLEASTRILKALTAAAVQGISRARRVQEAAPPTTPLVVTPAEVLGLTAAQQRPSHEPPAVPVRRVNTPQSVRILECGDHLYPVTEASPQEAGVYWKR